MLINMVYGFLEEVVAQLRDLESPHTLRQRVSSCPQAGLAGAEGSAGLEQLAVSPTAVRDSWVLLGCSSGLEGEKLHETKMVCSLAAAHVSCLAMEGS